MRWAMNGKMEMSRSICLALWTAAMAAPSISCAVAIEQERLGQLNSPPLWAWYVSLSLPALASLALVTVSRRNFTHTERWVLAMLWILLTPIQLLIMFVISVLLDGPFVQ